VEIHLLPIVAKFSKKEVNHLSAGFKTTGAGKNITQSYILLQNEVHLLVAAVSLNFYQN